MQLRRPESELDEINSGSWHHCLPIVVVVVVEMNLIYNFA